jgi:outer membrane protein assembly factor BamB
LTDQKELWRYPEKAQNGLSFHAAPVLTPDGQLIAGSYGPSGYNLYSLDPANGQLKWTFEQAKNHYIASPLVTEDGIYAPNSDGNLYALDLQGQLLWTFTSEKPLWATPGTNDQCDCIFVAGMDHKIYAMDAGTGQAKWESEDLGGAIVATPVFSSDGTIFVGTFANELVALDAATGRAKWRFTADNWVWSPVSLVEETLYFGDSSGNLYAVEAASGKVVWKVPVGGSIVTQPLVAKDLIFVTTGVEEVYAYNMEGVRQWQTTLAGKLHGPVVASNGFLLVSPLNNENTLYVLTESGAQQWAFVPEK